MKANFVKISVTHSAFPNYLNWQCILESWNVSGKIHRRLSDIGSLWLERHCVSASERMTFHCALLQTTGNSEMYMVGVHVLSP